MAIVAGALPSLLPKLAELLVGEYNLQKEVKGGIIFLQAELESMQGALEKISKTPVDKLDDQDKIWGRNVREMSYDIEDTIDKFMVRCKGREPTEQDGFKEAIERTLKWLRQPKIRHKIAKEIREIKSRVKEVAERRDRYKINIDVDKHVTIDPRLLAQYEKVTELVGINEAREEVIKILVEGNEACKKQEKIVSIIGFGGLGKTTLANVVFEELKAQFECSAFVSVSQAPDMEKLLKDMFYKFAKKSNESTNITDELREFLENKRYFVVIDDIWDIQVWKMFRHALPDNDVGYTIITTTRIPNVAEQAGGAYKLKPLSLNNSRKLLYRRIFGNENTKQDEGTEKCPDDELDEVSDKILKKCAGVPLAIITMASLLACKARNKMKWYEVYKSVGTGLENSLDVKNMRKILSLSYYALPCHLRTCLLYLSMFPEDFTVEKDRLIKMWIAEGFIQCDKQGKSLFELGESYFNELVNRSMIQPTYDFLDGMIYSCRVHDMVLDLICSLSSEENFVTIQNDLDNTSPSSTIRRLSLQSSKENHILAQATRRLQQARSVVVFPSAVALLPALALGSCRVLRVLDLEDCDLSQATTSLKDLRNLHHLRYLGLCKTCIDHLPEEIGNLQFLQTLNVKGNKISSLPSSVVRLRNLLCLGIDVTTRVPKGIGSLTCLEHLSRLRIVGSNINIIEDLCQLTEMRKLQIKLDKWNDKLLECLCKLEKIMNLIITTKFHDTSNVGGLDAWVAPRHLCVLHTRNITWFSTLPAWVNPSHLSDLTKLSIAVKELHQVDLTSLGRLPALRSLQIEVDNMKLGILGGFVVGADLFPCLLYCQLQKFVWPLVFQQRTMPRLIYLNLHRIYYVLEATSSYGGLDLGLGNLPSLSFVDVLLLYQGASKQDARQVKAALTDAAEMHPNHPRININTHKIDKMDNTSDDESS